MDHLYTSGQLRSVVLDEGHVYVMEQHFRFVHFRGLDRLQQLNVPVVVLSATLPRCIQQVIVGRAGLDPVRVQRIEQAFFRQGGKVRYLVRHCGRYLACNEAVDMAVDAVKRENRHVQVVVLTMRDLHQVASELEQRFEEAGLVEECEAEEEVERWKVGRLHGNLAMGQQQREVDAWVAGKTHCFVTTSAGIAGVNSPHVSMVIVVGATYDVLDMVQAFGRIRKREDGVAVLLYDGRRIENMRGWTGLHEKREQKVGVLMDNGVEEEEARKLCSIDTMSLYARGRCCRVQWIRKEIFGQEEEEACDQCDVCCSDYGDDGDDGGGDDGGADDDGDGGVDDDCDDANNRRRRLSWKQQPRRGEEGSSESLYSTAEFVGHKRGRNERKLDIKAAVQELFGELEERCPSCKKTECAGFGSGGSMGCWVKWTSEEYRRKYGQDTRRCYQCGGGGHGERRCPEGSMPRLFSVEKAVCYFCMDVYSGRHERARCPMKKRLHMLISAEYQSRYGEEEEKRGLWEWYKDVCGEEKKLLEFLEEKLRK
jgi:superfamily II DNA/RNA helicase